MVRLYLFIICFLVSASSFAQDTLTITAGSSLFIGPAGLLTLNNASFRNDGGFSMAAGSSEIRFKGNATSYILGANLPLFDMLAVEKSGGAELVLQRGVNIRTACSFSSGFLNLNGNTLFLATNAILMGESPTGHITGTSGYVEGSMVLNAPVSQNPANLGAIISSAQNLGLVIVRRGHQSQTNTAGSGNSILRYYDISSSNNTSLDATLRFHYFDDELNGLPENTLVLWKSTGGGQWANQGFTSRDVGINYVEKTGIESFSRWTLSSPNNALPVVYVFFNTHCENGRVAITWKTAQEMKSNYFNIERSQDGRNWAVIGTMQAAGMSNTERTYRFTDNAPLPDGLYRIAQHDLDGNRQYSVVVHSSCDVKDNINLWPNPAQTTAWLSITTNTGSPVTVKLYDSKGTLVYMRKATLTPGTNQLAVPVDRLPKGMYNVAADFMNGTIKTLRLVKN
jgi:hypothetical protein